MTTFVEEANTVGWSTSQGLGTRDTDNAVLPNGITISFMGNRPITTNNSADRSTNMANPGKFVALVYLVEFNNSIFPTTVEARINNVGITGMQIIIPAGAIGTFFSGQGVSEFSREFLRGDTIQVNIKKDPAEFINKGTALCTLMIAVEIEFGPVIPP